MKRNLLISVLAVFLVIIESSCKPEEEKICDCFLKQGIANKDALIGTWDFEFFGYTVNGEKIKEKEKIKQGNIIFHEAGEAHLEYWNSYYYTYSINNINGITLTGGGSTLMLPPGAEEQEKEDNISKCFLNAICYKTDNEKLYIHTEKINNYNVLILKKRRS